MNPRAVAIAQTTAVVVVSCFAGVLAKLALGEVSPQGELFAGTPASPNSAGVYDPVAESLRFVHG